MGERWCRYSISYFTVYSTNISGKYQVRATQGTCSAISNEVQQIFGELGSVSVYGTATFCGANTTTLFVSPTCSDYIYQWKLNGTNISGANASTYTTNISGVYTVTVTKGTKIISSNALSIYEDCSNNIITPSISQPSISSNTSDPVICSGSGKIMMYCNDFSSQYPTVTYQWYKNGVQIVGQTKRFLFVDDAGSYQVQLVVGTILSGLSNSYTLNNSGSYKYVTTPNGQYGCTDVLLTSPISTYTTKSLYNYQWKKDGVNISGATQNFYYATQTGTYSLDLTLGTCSLSSSNFPVTIGSENLSINASPTTSKLCDNGYVYLNSKLNSAVFHQWYKNNIIIPNANGQNYNATTVGNYSYTATQGACTYNSSSPVSVTASTSISSTIGYIGGINYGSNNGINVCNGSNTVLIVSPQAGRYQYQWKNGTTPILGANSSTYQPSTSGIYSADITTLGGCIITSPNLNLNSGTIPSFYNISSNLVGPTICDGLSTTISVGYQNFNSYQWYKDDMPIPNATGTNYVATSAGVYKAQLTQGTCNITTDFVVVKTDPSTLTPRITSANTVNDAFCNLTSASLSVPFASRTSYQWQKNGLNISGAVSRSFSTTQNGTFQVIVSQGNCTGTSNPIEIQNGLASTIYPNSQLSYICGEGASIVTNYIGSGGTYQWKKDGVSIGTSSQLLPINGVGTYTVTSSSINGCTVTSQPFVISSIIPIESTQTGTWSNSGIWNCLRIPNFSDNVKVNFGHIVSLPNTSTYFIKSINDIGNVNFGNGSNLKIGF